LYGRQAASRGVIGEQTILRIEALSNQLYRRAHAHVIVVSH
jgi:hypothetical protein